MKLMGLGHLKIIHEKSCNLSISGLQVGIYKDNWEMVHEKNGHSFNCTISVIILQFQKHLLNITSRHLQSRFSTEFSLWKTIYI